MTDILTRHGLSSLWNDPVAALTYQEGVLTKGDEVAACGVGRWEPDPTSGPAGGYRDPPRVLVVEATAQVPLMVSDDPELRHVPPS